MSDPASTAPARPTVTARGLLSAMLFVLLALFGAGVYFSTAFIVVPPIGALPEGVTLWVWRSDAMRFIDSPDAMCQRHMGGVSLLCRGVALASLRDRVIARLPYSESLYLWSTDGRTYSSPSRPRESPAAPSSDDATPSLSEPSPADPAPSPHDTTDPNKC